LQLAHYGVEILRDVRQVVARHDVLVDAVRRHGVHLLVMLRLRLHLCFAKQLRAMMQRHCVKMALLVRHCVNDFQYYDRLQDDLAYRYLLLVLMFCVAPWSRLLDDDC
jgi:hypothetical protein